MPSLLSVNRPLAQRSRLGRDATLGDDAKWSDFALLVTCGLLAVTASALIDLSLRVPGHAILKVVLPLSLGIFGVKWTVLAKSALPIPMNDSIQALQASTLAAISAAADDRALDEVRVGVLGKKGSLTTMAAGLRDLPPDQKPVVGQWLNAARTAITEALEARKLSLAEASDRASVSGVDVTLPGRALARGGLHPLTLIENKVIGILRRMGFAMATGPDVETEWHCFDALNTPADHPARNESDTFYFDSGKLLRTHTSSVQVRTMETQAPPVRIIAPGSAYRRDEIDATHLSVFNQIEGLCVDRGVTLADLKGTLEFFFRELYGPGTAVRFRPHFFPFTEPSFEIDVLLQAAGKEPRWIEIAGCGMVDPAVFESINRTRGDLAYDPMELTGFAFGMGLDRLAMIEFGLTDIRHLIENDRRFLAQFA